jgi:hypothetical protein
MSCCWWEEDEGMEVGKDTWVVDGGSMSDEHLGFFHTFPPLFCTCTFSLHCIAKGLGALYLYDDVDMIAGDWTSGQSIYRRRKFAILMSCIYLELHDIPKCVLSS